jgi:hypothetical protein
VLGAARHQHGGERKQQPGEPGLGVAPHHRSREEKHRQAVNTVSASSSTLRGRHADRRDQRKGQHVGEHRVVVQAQVDWRAQRQDFLREQRESPVRDDLVPEQPQIPDIDAGVTRNRPRQSVGKVQGSGQLKPRATTVKEAMAQR